MFYYIVKVPQKLFWFLSIPRLINKDGTTTKLRLNSLKYQLLLEKLFNFLVLNFEKILLKPLEKVITVDVCSVYSACLLLRINTRIMNLRCILWLFYVYIRKHTLSKYEKPCEQREYR